MNDAFQSSDEQRSAGPLAHAESYDLPGPLELERGGVLPQVTVAYETWGKLNAAGDNAVLVCHALSGDSHVARHDGEDSPGWWDLVVGPGKAIDTSRYFVICPNMLGSCRGTTGPNSANPETGRPYGADFPLVTVGDMVAVQRQLLDHLGIDKLLAVVGGSLGGMQALTWATRLPDRVRGCAAIATTPRLSSQALAFDVVARNAILRDPDFHDGQYYDRDTGPDVGLAIARMLGHITYLSRESMAEKFDPSRFEPRNIPTEFEKEFSVGSYLAYQGHKFVERFDANSYVTLSMAMDQFDLGGDRAALAETLGASRCRWLVISFTSDWLFPPFQSRAMVDAMITTGRPVSYCNVTSLGGHDAFLLEDELAIYGKLIESFLANVHDDAVEAGHGERESGASESGGARDPSRSGLMPPIVASDSQHAPTSIFHGARIDYNHILELVPESASVLDLGCGSGELLMLLKARGNRPAMGVELDQGQIVTCVERGLDVVQVDLNAGLPFKDQQFEVVVLSQALQSIADTERVIREMVRVGGRAIVSFPNFAHQKLRTMLFEDGRSPKSGGQYHYEWYNTPNRRFPSIADFQDFCRDKALTVEREVYLDTESDRELTVVDDPNRHADLAIFVISA